MRSASGSPYPAVAPVNLWCATDFGMTFEIIDGSSPGHVKHSDSNRRSFLDTKIPGMRNFLRVGSFPSMGNFLDMRAGWQTGWQNHHEANNSANAASTGNIRQKHKTRGQKCSRKEHSLLRPIECNWDITVFRLPSRTRDYELI
jgi:hypothetical protein